LTESLHSSAYRAVVERAVIVTVEAFDWNCPQHINPRFTTTELESVLAPVRQEIATLQAENVRLRSLLRDGR
jgi:predicted pyridoxine 5'-phosphate oxidase superfamily flavin-nucleotide-binding protein